MKRFPWLVVLLLGLGLVVGPLSAGLSEGAVPQETGQSKSPIPFRMIGVGDPLLEDYTFLLRSAGQSVLSLTPPLSSRELLRQLAPLSRENRSEAWHAAYDRVQKALSEPPQFQESPLGVSARPEVALEGKWRSTAEIEWIRPEKESPPVFTLPLEFFFSDIFYGRGDLMLRNDPSFYNSDAYPVGTNAVLHAERFDLNIPLRAFVSAGGRFWVFQLGRDRVSFGSGRTGNLTVSDTPDYFDFARLSLFSQNFKYTFFVTQLPLETPVYFFKQGYDVRTTDDIPHTAQRYLYLHRWDVRLWDRVSFSISEGVLVGNSPLELRYVNPFLIYHSLFSWRDYPRWGQHQGDMTGSLFSVEGEYALAGGFRLYGQMVMNQYATPYELDRWPDDHSPNGLGWLGGAEYSADLYGWQSVFYLEGVYTDPYLYVLSSPFASFIWMRRLSELTSKQLRYAWIGHQEGRDTLLLVLGASVRKDPFRIQTALSFRSRGEHTLLWDWEKGITPVRQATPTGVPEQTWKLSAQADWWVREPLTVSLYLAGSYVDNAQHVRDKQTLGVEAGLTARYRFY